MESVEDLIKKLKKLPKFIQDVSVNAIEKNKDEIVDMNKEQMLIGGVDSEGIPLGEYSPEWADVRQRSGLQTDHIDLRYTGDFQDSISVRKKNKKTFEIDAADPKWKNSLQPRFPDALGLDAQGERNLDKIVIQEIEHQVKNYI